MQRFPKSILPREPFSSNVTPEARHSRRFSTRLLPMKLLPIALLALAIGTSFAQTNQREFTAPDSKSTVRMLEKPMAGADVLLDFFTLEVRANGKVVAQVPTCGFLMNAYWSPDGSLLAVNNRRGNSGDYLWIFTIPGGKCIKRADDKIGESWVASALSAIKKKASGAKELNKSWLCADGWTPDGKLKISIRDKFNGGGTWDYSATVPMGKMTPEAATVKAAN